MASNGEELTMALERMRDGLLRNQQLESCLNDISDVVGAMEEAMEKAKADKSLEVFVRELDGPLTTLRDVANNKDGIREAVNTFRREGLKLARRLGQQ